MTNTNVALTNIEKKIAETIGAIVKFEAVNDYNGFTTYETQDLSKLTGILGGTLIKKAYLSMSSKNEPLKDGTYWHNINWHFDFATGSNGNEFMSVWTNEDGEILSTR